jgi:hypothetical protein
MEGGAGMHRADTKGAKPPRNRLCKMIPGVAREGLNLTPLVPCHRHQRSFAERDREILGRAGLLRDVDRVFKRFVATVEVAGQDARDPLHEHRGRRHETDVGEPPDALVCVGMHPLDAVPAEQRAKQGGPSFGGGVIRSRRVVVPPVHDIRPSLSGHRLPGQGGEHGCEHGDHRVSVHPTVFLQPSDPPLDGPDPTLPIGRHP